MTELNNLPAVFALEDQYREVDVYYPADAVCCGDMPLHELMEVAESDLDEQSEGEQEGEDLQVTPEPAAKKKRGRPRKTVIEGAGK